MAAATSDFDGERAFILRDDHAAAWVVPAIGANCIACAVDLDGRRHHLISTPPSAEALHTRPTYWGYPILSPYPGRHQVPFTWRGRAYRLVENDRPGVAIHGFVAGAPWEVLDASATSLTCRFDSESVANRAARWPWPFWLTATHRLEAGALILEITLENRADEEIPHLLGLHPYFPLRTAPASSDAGQPLVTAAELVGHAAEAARETCQLQIAADELWMMKAGLGTGEILRLEGSWDLREPKSVATLERELAPPPGPEPFGDDRAVPGPRLPVLLYGKREALRAHAAGLDPSQGGGVRAVLYDTAGGVALSLETSAGFGSLAVYCPPRQPFLSLEPRSAVSDALTLMNDPRRLDTGVWPLGPGQRWRAWARLALRPIR